MKSDSISFLISITDKCSSADLTSVSIEDKIYKIGSGPSIFTFDTWTSSVPDCGSISYIASVGKGPLPVFIKFDAAKRSFEISTATESLDGK